MTTHAFTISGTTTNYQWSVPLTGLTPGTQYCYAVFSTDASGAVDLLPSSQPDQMFTTLEPAGSTKSLTFDIVDDSGESTYSLSPSANSFPGFLNTDQAAIDKLVGQSGARFAILAGDTAYNDGSQTDFGNLQNTETLPGSEVSDFFGPSYWPQTGGIPTFKTNGDHGLNIESLQNFPTPATATASGGTYAYDAYPPGFGITSSFNEPDTWYAIQSGNVRIYVLDAAWNEQLNQGNSTGSLCGGNGPNCMQYEMDYNEHWQTTSPEYKWLAADLAAHPGGTKLAVFHYPFRSDTSSQPSDPYIQNSSSNPNAALSLESLLSANGVGVAFGGHAHNYSRIAPSQPGQIPNYVAGTGGGVLEPVDGGGGCDNPGSLSAYALGWSPGTTPPSGNGSSCGSAPSGSSLSPADVYSFLQVTVSGNKVTVTPTNAAGQTFDVQTYTLGTSSGGTPTTPGNVNAVAQSATSVQVTWSASSEAGSTVKSYNVYRSDHAGTPIGSVNAPSTSFTDTGAQPGTTYTYSVVAIDAAGHASGPGTSPSITTPGSSPPPPNSPSPPPSACMSKLPAGAVVGSAALGDGSGYFEVDSAGDVAAFGAAACSGSMTGTPLNKPIVGMAVDPATRGYWLVASDGGIFSFNAPFMGSTGNIALNKPIVGMASTPNGAGYWMVASDGGVFTFGNAAFYGSTGNIVLNKPVVGMGVDAETGGYWLVASDGGIFSFHAPFLGSTGNIVLNKPVVGMIAASDGGGYRLIASDGGVFCFNEPFFGSTGNIVLNRPVIAGLSDEATAGYWLTASDGGVFSFNAPFLGSAA